MEMTEYQMADLIMRVTADRKHHYNTVLANANSETADLCYKLSIKAAARHICGDTEWASLITLMLCADEASAVKWADHVIFKSQEN